jgi:hypothetical protein
MTSEFEMAMQNAVHASLSKESSATTESSASAPQVDAVSTAEAETPAATPTVTVPETPVEDAVMTEAAAEPEQRAASPTFSDNDYDILETTPLVDGVVESKTQEPEPEPASQPSPAVDAQTAQQQRAKRWQKELVAFAGMGFTDFPKLLDLFEQHIGSPGSPGTDRVLDALLS